jgi:hypothetical protein
MNILRQRYVNALVSRNHARLERARRTRGVLETMRKNREALARTALSAAERRMLETIRTKAA